MGVVGGGTISDKDESLMTTAELCEWLKIGKSTAGRWREQGMPYIGRERSLRYKRSEIEKWLDEQKHKK